MAHEKLATQARTARRSDLKGIIQDRLKRFRSLFEECPLNLISGMHHGDQTKYLRYNLTHLAEPIDLIQITDMQFGHVLCKEDKVIAFRDWVLAKPNRYMLWTGDNVDAGTKLSVGSPWEQKMEPQGQIYSFCEIWAPARHRILAYVGGNHERRGVPTFGDLGSLIAYLLEIPYSGGRQFIDFQFGRKTIGVDLWHGTGAARTAGAQMMMLDRFMQTGDADVYLCGHIHTAMVRFFWRMRRKPWENTIRLHRVGGAISTSFLEYFNTYAEVAGMAPSGLLMARIVIKPSGQWELVMGNRAVDDE